MDGKSWMPRGHSKEIGADWTSIWRDPHQTKVVGAINRTSPTQVEIRGDAALGSQPINGMREPVTRQWPRRRWGQHQIGLGHANALVAAFLAKK